MINRDAKKLTKYKVQTVSIMLFADKGLKLKSMSYLHSTLIHFSETKCAIVKYFYLTAEFQ